MKERIKGMIGMMVTTPLAISAMGTLGGLTGSLKGIGSATSSVVGVGLLSQSAKLIKWK